MAVVFAANELEAFRITGVNGVFNRTVSGEYDANYCRVGMAVTTVAQLIADLPSAQTDMWLHFEVSFLQRVSGTGGQCVQLIDSATDQVVLQLDFDASTSPHECDLEYWNGASFTELGTLHTFNQYSTSADRYTIDIHCKISDTAGRFAWYVNGSFKAEVTGDTLNTGYTQVDQIKFLNPNAASTTSTTSTVFSQVIVANQSTVGWKLGTMYPDGNGTHTAWTGAYTEVDQNGIQDTDFITGSTAGHKETVTLTAGPSTTSKQIIAIVGSARCLRRGAASMSIDIRSGSTDGVGDFFTPDVSLEPHQQMFYGNPDTGGPWAGADLAALEIGVNVRAIG